MSSKDKANARMVRYRATHRVRLAAEMRARYHNDASYRLRKWNARLVRDYGITLETYRAILAAQGHACKLCCKPLLELRRETDVDHDHATGEVRGILCGPCNRAIGVLGDTLTGVMRAVNYLTPPTFVDGAGAGLL